MNKIRVYLTPKGYKDYICESVIIQPILGGYQVVINGGEHDKEVIPNGCGGRLIKENVDE